MTHFSGSAPRASSEHSAWDSLGEITLPAEFDPRRSNLPALISVVEVLRLPSPRQRQVERAVCEAVSTVWGSTQNYVNQQPISVRVFCQKQQNQQARQTHTSKMPVEAQVPTSSWGFFIISNLEAEPGTNDLPRTIELFLYPEG